MLFAGFFFFRLASALARDHDFDRGGGHLLADALLVQPAFEARPYVRVLFRHDRTLSQIAMIFFLDSVTLLDYIPRRLDSCARPPLRILKTIRYSVRCTTRAPPFCVRSRKRSRTALKKRGGRNP